MGSKMKRAAKKRTRKEDADDTPAVVPAPAAAHVPAPAVPVERFDEDLGTQAEGTRRRWSAP